MEFPSHIPCWLRFYEGSFSYTSRAVLIFIWGVYLTHPMLASLSLSLRWGVSLKHPMLALFIFIWGVSLTHPVLASFLSGECLLHTPCWLHFYLAGFIFMEGISLTVTHPVLFLIILFYILFFIWGVPHTHLMLVSFCFIWGVSLTHPVLVSFFYRRSFSYTFRAGCIFVWGVSPTHPVLASFFYREFLWGVSLKHPVLASFFSGEFFLHIPCSFSFSFFLSFFFIWGVSLTHLMDVLTIPTAYQKRKCFFFFFSFCGSIFLEKENK